MSSLGTAPPAYTMAAVMSGCVRHRRSRTPTPAAPGARTTRPEPPAQRAPRDDNTGNRSPASRLGYASESAFGTAFERVVGEAPAHCRERLHAGSADS
ncbi:hypothetical protein [Streptomyces sp. NPDC018972]|uniref:hypothetical protein n=1 Tax=Streptomyces sp. NPDC018972 TaxID=3365060 RepID=UPI0037B450A0